MKTIDHQRPAGAPVATLAMVLALLLAGGHLAACSGAAGEGDGGGSGAAARAAGAESRVLATVGGVEVTRDEVETAAADQLRQVENQLAQCRSQAEQRRHEVVDAETRKLVRERLLADEAAARGVTEDELLQAEVQSRVAEVTPEEVDAFFEQNRARIGPMPKEEVAPQIQQYLRQERESRAYQEFIEGLERRREVSYAVEPYRAELAIAGKPARGPEAAPVTIVEFSDFECPFCSRVVPTLDRIQEEYGDRVRLVFKQFPLRNIHPNAQKAAEASLCANDQGKFWELHDAMFADQRNLSVPSLKAKAGQLGLDAREFDGCLDSGRYAEAVEEDLQEGSRAGVTGTPAMFVNGRLLSGAVPYEEIARMVDEELARRGGRS